jgi:hypothetical protein
LNEYTAQQVTVGLTFADELLTALTTRPAAAIIAAGKIRLSQDPAFNPTPQSTVAALAANEATYSGYAAGGIALVLTVGLNLSPSIVGAVASALFVASGGGPFVSNNVYGYWVDDGTNLVVGEKFAGGGIASFGAPGDFLDLNVAVPLALGQKTS